MARKTLTDKAKRFVDEYLIDRNASAACIRAGYSSKSAKQIGCELLASPTLRTRSLRRRPGA
ncbi:terminase small subunit [Bordetella genomosp. 1]|uniref:terminase small subunit n=1 Tax=Bordetella genomosp. 1 TaxID=1395607 RepID=UPI001C52B2AC|nr:terminase small subunit [Bordetella genomosp. 1]